MIDFLARIGREVELEATFEWLDLSLGLWCIEAYRPLDCSMGRLFHARFPTGGLTQGR
jgi:hypothetical protein